MNSYPFTTVGGLIFANDGTCLLVKAPKWNNLWSVPGGKVHDGETMESAFIREVKEETNLDLGRVKYAFFQESIYSPQFYEKKHFIMHDYIAHLAEGSDKNNITLNDEATLFTWVTPKEALNLPIIVELRKLLEWYLHQNQAVYGVKEMKVSCSVGKLPEEEAVEQDLLLDIAVTRTDEVNEYTFKEISSRVAKKGFEELKSFADELVAALHKELDANTVELTVRKANSPIGIPTYITIKR